MTKTKIFLGVDQYGSFVEAELNDGIIRGFSGYDYIPKSRSADDNEYLSMNSWSHETKVKGMTLKTGDVLPAKMPKISKENQRIYSEAYQNEGLYCDSCGTFHDSDQYSDLSYVIVNECEVKCRECADFSDMVKTVSNPDDLFKAPDVSGIDVPEEYVEVDTLFCDSSGFGSSSESALTKNQAILKIETLLETHGELYAGITDIGQFQVYVTLWTKAA
jgi:hypothetical protein